MKVWAVLGFMGMMLACSQATIMGGDDFSIDFTDANCVAEHVLMWKPAEKVKQTDRGLIFDDSRSNVSVDLELLTQSYAVGLSWRPTSGVSLKLAISDSSSKKTSDDKTRYGPNYAVYVRYSPDLKHWSAWQIMQSAVSKTDSDESIYQCELYLNVPEKVRQRYQEYNQRYWQLDVPWTSDEEAMVQWLLEQEPDFFEKEIPFIGYIQFLCESNMRAGQTLAKADISVSWGVGGRHSFSKDEAVYKERMNSMRPWCYRAPDATLQAVLTPMQKKMGGQ